jgi:hypothetical protein
MKPMQKKFPTLEEALGQVRNNHDIDLAAAANPTIWSAEDGRRAVVKLTLCMPPFGNKHYQLLRVVLRMPIDGHPKISGVDGSLIEPPAWWDKTYAVGEQYFTVDRYEQALEAFTHRSTSADANQPYFSDPSDIDTVHRLMAQNRLM